MRLETERLVIRPWRLDEAPRMLDIKSRVEVVRWLGDGEPRVMADLDAARAEIAGHATLSPPLGEWAIEVAASGVPAGTVLLVPIPESDGLVQIGWHLHPDSHGLGYATEAARAVLAHGLATAAAGGGPGGGLGGGLGEIRALTHLDNHPSIAVALRLGMRDLGVTEEWYATPSRHFLATAADLSDGALSDGRQQA